MACEGLDDIVQNDSTEFHTRKCSQVESGFFCEILTRKVLNGFSAVK